MINDKGFAGKVATTPVLRGIGRLLSLSFIIYHLSFSLAIGQTQYGNATFYGRKATGRMTANGERLHHDSMTCAHRTYPFGTLLQVTNTQNGKKVVVRVTDRGPFAPGRIIDLSWGAARELGILQQGVCPVIVEQVFPVRIPLRTDIKYEAPRFSTDGLVLGVSLDSLISSWLLVR